jgi:hypothetical protein
LLASCFASATFSFVPFAPHNSLEQGEIALLQCRKLLALRAGGGFEAVDSFGDIVKLTINPPRARGGKLHGSEQLLQVRNALRSCRRWLSLHHGGHVNSCAARGGGAARVVEWR